MIFLIFQPGLDYNPGFRQFSGYLDIPNSEKHIFYWYTESQRDPAADPVAFWTNGGPGCSGLYGFGTEMGPYHFQADGTVKENPYTWNKIAGMLYVEQPAGVGFSYSENTDDYKTGDEQAALDNYEVIKAFFRKFPERKTNDFYLSSESYGGHYIPQLALTIIERDVDNEINLKGFAVGNAYVEPTSNDVAMYELYYQHGLVSKLVHDRWVDAGCLGAEAYPRNATVR